MKKKVIAVVAVVALVGAAIAAVPIVESHAAGRIKTEIERDGAVKVGNVEVGLFERRITLLDLKSSSGAELSVGRWEASGLAWPLGELIRGRTPLAGFNWGDPLQADRIELRDVRLVDSAANSGWSMGSLIMEGFDLARYDARYQGGDYKFQALVARALGALTIRRLEERNVAFSLPGADTFGAGPPALRSQAWPNRSVESSAHGESSISQKFRSLQLCSPRHVRTTSRKISF